VVGIFINQVLAGEPLSIFGDGEQTRAFSYVGDVVPAIARAPFADGARGEVFNVGADTPCTINRLATVVRDAMGAPDHPVVHHEPRNEVTHAFSDHSKARRVFGDRETTSLEPGVERMVGWAREHGPRSSPPFAGIEVPRKLPPSWLTETAARRD
jgi:UDP-glucose 4-epimerase